MPQDSSFDGRIETFDESPERKTATSAYCM